MRLLPIIQCEPGMRLGKKIFSQEGLVLLGEDVELTQRLITRLAQNGIHYVYVKDAKTEDIVIPVVITEETLQASLKEVKSTFRLLAEPPSNSKGSRPFISRDIKTVMSRIIDELFDNKDAMIMLLNMGTVDHYLYQHSLNVCVYTTLLGVNTGYSREELLTLSTGALLHDVGKMQIPIEIMNKPGKLSDQEYEIMKKHAWIGYEQLKDEPNLSMLVAHCALQHHERIDGSGYPRGIKGDDIHEYAKWIGIVDSYDAMTTYRGYRAPLLPHDALERLYAGSGILYEQRMLQHFRDKVAVYPIGISVQLHTGEVGVVVALHQAYPHRPVVRVLYNEAGEELTQPYELDLTKKLNIMITGIPGLRSGEPLEPSF